MMAETMTEKENNNQQLHVFYGYNCYLVKQAGGYWCGYVEVPLNHPGIVNDNLDVHCGVTWNDPYLPWYDEQQRAHPTKHYLGFDCGHSCDVIPYLSDPSIAILNSMLGGSRHRPTYKTEEFAKEQLKNLAKQLKEMDKNTK